MSTPVPTREGRGGVVGNFDVAAAERARHGGRALGFRAKQGSKAMKAALGRTGLDLELWVIKIRFYV